MSEPFKFMPMPKREGAGITASVADRVVAWAERIGSEASIAKQFGRQPADVLYETLLMIGSEEVWAWDDKSQADFDIIRLTYGVIAHHDFDPVRRLSFLEDYRRDRESGLLESNNIALTSDQGNQLQQIAARVGIQFNPTIESIPLDFLASELPKRITDTPDEEVTKILQGTDEDRVNRVIDVIGSMPLRRQILLLLGLTPDEYAEFKRRNHEGIAGLLKDLEERPDIIPDPIERIKARSALSHGVPVFEIQTDMRRRYLDQGMQYPISLDLGLEIGEDPRFKPDDDLPRMTDGVGISYEEAIVKARFNYARKFYRDHYYPSITRSENPISISAESLLDMFRTFINHLEETGKPATDITMHDLLRVLDHLLEREADNDESCRIHSKIRVIAQIVASIEESLDKK